MKPLRKLLDNLKPNFTNGGALEKYFPLYDVFENLFYSSDKRTFGSVHIRDSIDLQKGMLWFGWQLFQLCSMGCTT
jgi:Na+-transporting NADH:ubiquinone oxidoreductase subunit B